MQTPQGFAVALEIANSWLMQFCMHSPEEAVGVAGHRVQEGSVCVVPLLWLLQGCINRLVVQSLLQLLAEAPPGPIVQQVPQFLPHVQNT